MTDRVVAASCVLAIVLACEPAQASPRAFVASYGTDANTASNCAPTTPCRGFTAAMGVVDAGGEIIALDAAGFGAVSITKSVTIAANPGFYAGVAASTGNAITISTPGVSVALRGLYINNAGAATNGIAMTRGTRLSVENCVISNFTVGYGIGVTGTIDNSSPIYATIVDTVVRNSQYGVLLQDGAQAVVRNVKLLGNDARNGDGISVVASFVPSFVVAEISDVVVTSYGNGIHGSPPNGANHIQVRLSGTSVVNNGNGLTADPGGTVVMTISGSSITGNSNLGFSGASATWQSLGNNVVFQNGTDLGPGVTISPLAGM